MTDGAERAYCEEALASAGLANRHEPSRNARHVPRKQADTLIELALSAQLFHAPSGTCFADVDVNGHRETWPIRSKGFRHWLTRQFFESEQSAPSSEALKSALNVIEAKAQHDRPERDVYVRIAEHDGKLYLDLADSKRRAAAYTPRLSLITDIPARRPSARALNRFAIAAPGLGPSTVRREKIAGRVRGTPSENQASFISSHLAPRPRSSARSTGYPDLAARAAIAPPSIQPLLERATRRGRMSG
jgi:hypothetical protein